MTASASSDAQPQDATNAQDEISVDSDSWWTLGITAVATFMVSLEVTVISLAFSEIQDTFEGTSRATLSWIFTAYNIGVAALLLLSGWAADRYGRKKIFIAGLFVFMLGSLASGLSVNAPTLIAARALQSVGGAMQFPAGLALLLPAFPPSRRGMAIGLWGATGALAAALGPTIGALLINGFGWRSIFLVNVPIAVAAIAIGSRKLTESRAEDLPDRVDGVSVPMASIGIGLLVLAIAQADSWGLVSLPIAAAVLGSMLLLWLFVHRSRRHPAPLFDLTLLSIRSFTVAQIGTLFFCAAFFGWFVVLPSFMLDWWEWSILKTGFAMLPGPLIAALVSPAVGRIADTRGVTPVLTVGGITGAIGLGAHLVFTTETPDFLLGILLPSVFVGIASGCSFAMLVAASMRDIPPQRFGMAGAGRTTAFQLAVALGIALGAAVIGDPGSLGEALSNYRTNWTLALLFFVAQALVFAFAYPRRAAPVS